VNYKQQLEAGYEDLLHTVEFTSSCEDSAVATDIVAVKDVIAGQDLTDFEADLVEHFARYLDFQQVVNSGCVIE
jgi:hypothetical protein